MKTLTFTDGRTLEVSDISSTTAIFMEYNSYSSVDTVRAYFTEANLKNATLTDEDGNVQTLVNIVPLNVQVNSGYDGAVSARYNLREKTELELIKEEINALHAEQEVQDEAIDFLAMNS